MKLGPFATVLGCLTLLLMNSGAVVGSPATKDATSTAQVTVDVHPVATVSGDFFSLGEFADIRCLSKPLKALVSQAVMGRSPIEGTTRQIEIGDICLKLRQAGLDPNQVHFTGASTVQIGCAAASGQSAQPPVTPSAQPGVVGPSPAPAQPDGVRSGDTVDLILEDGAVTVETKATAIENGLPGQHILLRRDGTDHTLSGTVIDSQTVRLEED